MHEWGMVKKRCPARAWRTNTPRQPPQPPAFPNGTLLLLSNTGEPRFKHFSPLHPLFL